MNQSSSLSHSQILTSPLTTKSSSSLANTASASISSASASVSSSSFSCCFRFPPSISSYLIPTIRSFSTSYMPLPSPLPSPSPSTSPSIASPPFGFFSVAPSLLPFLQILLISCQYRLPNPPLPLPQAPVFIHFLVFRRPPVHARPLVHRLLAQVRMVGCVGLLCRVLQQRGRLRGRIPPREALWQWGLLLLHERRYEGDWVDNRYDGYGVETWAKGSRYRGQYRQGSRHGFGVYRFCTGSVYAGEWLNGQCHGCGVHTSKYGSLYVGEWKWGIVHGLGHDHFRNGDTYAGEYSEDKMHGFGVYCFANGLRYKGAWHEGRMLGLGMYTLINEETVSGNWQNGVPDTLSLQNTHDGFPVAVNHSEVLDAVQEARRAAEKAFDVTSVDERVNEAVAVANEAANKARVVAVKAVQKRNNGNEDDTPIPIVCLFPMFP